MRIVFFFFAGALFAFSALGQNKADANGWVSLFNGKNLSGWEARIPEGKQIWTVKNGVIDCEPKLKVQGDKNLWSKKSYKDFQLRVDWRIKEKKGIYNTPVVLPDGSYKLDAKGQRVVNPQPGADSGVLLRGASQAQVNIWCWPIGSGEVYGYRNKQSDPAIRKGVTPRMRADREVGEWNTFEITMKGDRLTVVLNGKIVIRNAHLPDVPTEGPIAFQHHGGYDDQKKEWNGASSLVQFRNISIREL